MVISDDNEETKIAPRGTANKNKSPYKRFQVNEEFFKNAPKDGEIEIRMKSPYRGSNYERQTHTSAVGEILHESADPVHQAFLKASPKREKGERADPTYNNENFFRGDGVKDALNYPNHDDDENWRRRKGSPSKQVLGDIPAGIPSRQKQSRSPPREEISERKVKISYLLSNLKLNIAGQFPRSRRKTS